MYDNLCILQVHRQILVRGVRHALNIITYLNKEYKYYCILNKEFKYYLESRK